MPKKTLAPSSTTNSFPTWGEAETQLGSEELVVEDPEDWAVILKEIRNNVQSRAASLLGFVQDDLRGRHVPIVSHKSRPTGSKVHLWCCHRCCFSALIKPHIRAPICLDRAT